MGDDEDLVGDEELAGEEDEEGEEVGEEQGGEEEPAGGEEAPPEGEEGGEEDDEMVQAMEEEMEEEGDSNMMVEYNRQYYLVPNKCKKRDYKRVIVAPSAEVLGEMVASQASAAKWPLASTIDPAAVVVLKGKFKKDDTEDSYAWYVRIVVEGSQDGDDKFILRHIPKGVCKEFIKFLSEDQEMSASRLVTQHQPPDYNQRVIVPLKDVSNWTEVPTAQKPRSLAIKPVGQGGKTKADAAVRGGDGADKESPAAKKAAPHKKPAAAAASKKPATPAPAPAPAPVATSRGKTSLGKAPAPKQTTLVASTSSASKGKALAAAPPKKPAAKPPVAKPAAKSPPPPKPPTPVPSEGGGEEDDGNGNGTEAPKGTMVPQTEPWPLVARDTDCVERCLKEDQTITHTYKGFNEAADKYEPGQFLINKVMIPITASSYKVTVEYTLPALEG